MNTENGERDYKTCGAKKSNGGACALPAGHGTSHPGHGNCKLHMGSTPSHVDRGQRDMAVAEMRKLGIPIQVNPAQALLNEVWEAAGNVAYYRELVQELEPRPGDDEWVVDHNTKTGGYWKYGKPGIYGNTRHVSGIPTGEAKPHVVVTLYNEERDRLAKLTVAALKVGLAERQVKLAETQGAMLAQAIKGILTDLGVADRPEVPSVVRRHLAAVAS